MRALENEIYKWENNEQFVSECLWKLLPCCQKLQTFFFSSFLTQGKICKFGCSLAQYIQIKIKSLSLTLDTESIDSVTMHTISKRYNLSLAYSMGLLAVNQLGDMKRESNLSGE